MGSEGIDGSGTEAVTSASTLLERDLHGLATWSGRKQGLFGEASSNEHVPS